MTQADAERFAREWIEAWNSHDLERILAHYTEDVEVTSPLIESVLGPGRDTVRGKAAVRGYWGPALQKFPDLRFTLKGVFAGVRSVVLHYESIRRLMSAELMELNEQGMVRRVVAHYTGL